MSLFLSDFENGSSDIEVREDNMGPPNIAASGDGMVGGFGARGRAGFEVGAESAAACLALIGTVKVGLISGARVGTGATALDLLAEVVLVTNAVLLS